VDAGLVPSIEYQRIPGLRLVPGLGIAAASEVRSVLLVSNVSRERIRSVSLDPASRSSAALVRILLRKVYGIQPEYGEELAGADAQLVIGDPALKTRLDGRVILDLAAEWRAFSGHPFVFAVWAVRSESAGAEVTALLRRSYESALANFDTLVREEAEAKRLSEAVVEDYLRHALHYELDAGDAAGLDLFFRLAFEEGLIPAARPLEFASSA
jgi:chorismate dehydratase